MRKAAAGLFLLLLALGVPAGAATHKSKRNFDLADTVDNTVILSKFAALVRASDLGTFLSSRGPFTLFAPTNSAFSKLPPGMFEDLLRPENKEQLQRIILYHLINGQNVDAKDLQTLKSLPSCEGNPIPLKLSRAGTQFVGGARLLRADQKCANGVMDQVDTLLMPPKLGVLVTSTTPPPLPTPVTSAPDMHSPGKPGSKSSASGSEADPNPVPDTTEHDKSVPAIPPQ
jgi:uncharacterized surface protein with fasciclin (FAS1) repeats